MGTPQSKDDPAVAAAPVTSASTAAVAVAIPPLASSASSMAASIIPPREILQLDGFGRPGSAPRVVDEADCASDRSDYGTIVCKDGSRFEGQINQSHLPQGLGVRWTSLGQMFECGLFDQGKLQRSCPVPLQQASWPAAFRARSIQPATLRLCPDHLWYEGEVNEGYQRHGRGTLFSESGVAVAKGTWHEDKLHGNGQFACTRGRVYRGNLVNGLPHGLGQLRYPNGDMFEGEFANGKKIGRGIKWNAAGVVIECGTYSAGFLKRQKMTTGPVPRSMLPYGQRLSALARTASLLFPDGGCFVGPLNSELQPDGVGTRYNVLGMVTEAGLWGAGVIKRSAMVAMRSAPAQGGRRMALVMANANYLGDGTDELSLSSPTLRPTMQPTIAGVTNSGKRMEACLLELGFDSVESCFDGGKHTMTVAIRSLIDSLQPRDLVFLYFIGHGAQVNGTTYLAPVDLCGAPMTDFAISIKHIRDQISSSANCQQLTVVMALDCCRVELDESRSCSEDEEEGLPRGLQLQHEVSRSAGLSRAASFLGSPHESRQQRSARLAKASVQAGNEYFIMHANESALPARTADGLGAFTRELLEWLPKRLELKEMFHELSVSLRAHTMYTDDPQQATSEGSLSRRIHLDRDPEDIDEIVDTVHTVSHSAPSQPASAISASMAPMSPGSDQSFSSA